MPNSPSLSPAINGHCVIVTKSTQFHPISKSVFANRASKIRPPHSKIATACAIAARFAPTYRRPRGRRPHAACSLPSSWMQSSCVAPSHTSMSPAAATAALTATRPPASGATASHRRSAPPSPPVAANSPTAPMRAGSALTSSRQACCRDRRSARLANRLITCMNRCHISTSTTLATPVPAAARVEPKAQFSSQDIETLGRV